MSEFNDADLYDDVITARSHDESIGDDVSSLFIFILGVAMTLHALFWILNLLCHVLIVFMNKSLLIKLMKI